MCKKDSSVWSDMRISPLHPEHGDVVKVASIFRLHSWPKTSEVQQMYTEKNMKKSEHLVLTMPSAAKRFPLTSDMKACRKAGAACGWVLV